MTRERGPQDSRRKKRQKNNFFKKAWGILKEPCGRVALYQTSRSTTALHPTSRSTTSRSMICTLNFLRSQALHTDNMLHIWVRTRQTTSIRTFIFLQISATVHPRGGFAQTSVHYALADGGGVRNAVWKMPLEASDLRHTRTWYRLFTVRAYLNHSYRFFTVRTYPDHPQSSSQLMLHKKFRYIGLYHTASKTVRICAPGVVDL